MCIFLKKNFQGQTEMWIFLKICGKRPPFLLWQKNSIIRRPIFYGRGQSYLQWEAKIWSSTGEKPQFFYEITPPALQFCGHHLRKDLQFADMGKCSILIWDKAYEGRHTALLLEETPWRTSCSAMREGLRRRSFIREEERDYLQEKSI